MSACRLVAQEERPEGERKINKWTNQAYDTVRSYLGRRVGLSGLLICSAFFFFYLFFLEPWTLQNWDSHSSLCVATSSNEQRPLRHNDEGQGERRASKGATKIAGEASGNCPLVSLVLVTCAATRLIDMVLENNPEGFPGWIARSDV